MTKLLINGCSYATCWGTPATLASRLGFDSVINLARLGASNDRIFRTTVNYIIENPDVGMVIVPLTGWDRFEAPWIKNVPPADCWVDYGPYDILNHTLATEFPVEFYHNYIQDRHRYDIDIRYVEKFLADLIMFTGFLESQNTRYLIFSSCGGFFPQGEGPEKYGKKMDLVRSNKRIIDLETWCSNEYLEQHGAGYHKEEQHVPASGRHYHTENHNILDDFVYTYILTNKLL